MMLHGFEETATLSVRSQNHTKTQGLKSKMVDTIGFPKKMYTDMVFFIFYQNFHFWDFHLR